MGMGLMLPALALAAPAPSIDGSLEDPFWRLHARTWAVASSSPGSPEHSAQFYLGLDDRYLYLAADVNDQNVLATHRQRKSETWEDDSVEFFIDVGDGAAQRRTPQSWQYAFSAGGGVNWTRGTDGNSLPGHDWPPAWNSQVQWSVRLKVGTTLNMRLDRDSGYVIEARIPLGEFEQPGLPYAERTIGINFVNINRTGEGASSEWLSLVPGLGPDTLHEPRRWLPIRTGWLAPSPLRGLAQELPLWLGTDANGGAWRRYESAERDPAGAWLDRRSWLARLDRMRAQQLTALLLVHPDPLSGLTAPAGTPGRGYFSSTELPGHVEQLRWILREAHGRSIRVYLSTELPGSPATTRPATGSAAEPQPSFGQLAGTLLRTYPELHGLAIRVSSDSATQARLLLDGIAEAFRAGASLPAAETQAGGNGQPELLLWLSDPSVALVRGVRDIWPKTRVLHDTAGGRWTAPELGTLAAGLEAKMAGEAGSRAKEPLPPVAIGGPRGPLEYLYWCDPAWIRDLWIDVRRRGFDGMFLWSEPDAHNWLLQEIWSAYSIHPGDVFNSRRWQKRLDEYYAAGQHSGQLLEAMQHASAVMPEFLKLVVDESPHYRPQFGLPLAYYLELPRPANEAEPATRPAVTAAEDNAAVKAYARRAEQAADRLRQHTQVCRSLLTGLRHVQPEQEPQARALSDLLDRIELNAAMGEHFEHKIRAALAWKLARRGRGRSVACVRELDQSVAAWKAVSRLTTRLFPSPVLFWQMQTGSPPPWTREQVERSYRLVQGHWRDQLPLFETELNLIRERMDRIEQGAAAPVWDELSAERVSNLAATQRIGFELENDRRVRLSSGASVTSERGLVLGERSSLLVDTRGLGPGVHTVMVTDPSFAPLLSHRPYDIRLAYRVLDRGRGDPEPFEVGLRSEYGGPAIGELRRWGAPEGHLGTRYVRVPPPSTDRYGLFVDVHGEAAIVIDQISINYYLASD
ncbi:MAG: hypothetical protein AMXMBFR13_35310 [Phycisphaerae bacterium]